MAADLSQLDLLAIQIDGIHITDELILLAAVGIDGDGVKRPLELLEGATKNAAVVQALLDKSGRTWIRKFAACSSSMARRRYSRRSVRPFGRHTPVQRCQIHKARNIVERLPKHLHASVRKALRQAWELDDVEKAERLLRNLAQRLEQVARGVTASILEGHLGLL